ncbi:MAG: ABC transporter permease subunit [Chloroflexota bacterium]|nr:ABC transporter permease subunit [Chloroflexota bacterium]
MSGTANQTDRQPGWFHNIRSGMPQEQWEMLLGVSSLLLRRLFFGSIVLVAIAYLSHFGLAMARGVGFEEALGRAVPDAFSSLGRVITGDLGLSTSATSTLNPVPVIDVLKSSFINSMGLLGASLLISVVISVPLGILAARVRRSGWSLFMLLITIAGVSVPSFFAAFLLQRLAIRVSQSIGSTFLPVGGFGWDTHIILPALVLAARPIAQITRVTFASLREVLAEDYVRTAHSKGLPQGFILWRHVIRNAAIPIVTTIGLSLRYSLISLPVVELFFGWPGLGYNLLRSIARQDNELTVVLLLSLGVLFVVVNFILELTYRLIDPRLRQVSDRISRSESRTILERMGDFLEGAKDLLRGIKLPRWLRSDKGESMPGPLIEATDDIEEIEVGGGERGGRAWSRIILGNTPLIVGIILIIGLGVVFFFGYQLSPHNPYTTSGLTIVDGEISVPPFEPGVEYPWGTDVLGRDMMSLVLTGAWQTLRLVIIVVVVRLGVGFLLGAIAGWNVDKWIDRGILGLGETISAFPSLLLAMTLILAIGIRKGLTPFIIALAFVGWGEVMQFVRSAVMAMRPKTFVEAAVSVGQRTPRILTKHVLPNLIPTLILISALEMGAVLMLLGELGFVGIFIGGGAFAELSIGAPPYHYSDVPEWGALLSNVRLYAFSYPWTALYPALAFFIAILAFNLFGEGVRQLIEDVGVRITRLVNRYTVGFTAIVLLLLTWMHGSTGALRSYSVNAETFDGQRALAYTQELSSAAFEGRALGSDGMAAASEWIAYQFEELGLQAAGEELTYFQTRTRDYERLDSTPTLSVEGLPLDYREDFSEFPGYTRILGEASGPVRFVAIGEQIRQSVYGRLLGLQDYDFSGEIVMVSSGLEAYYMTRIPHGGVLVIADDPLDIERRYTLSPRDPTGSVFGTNRQMGQDSPMLWITKEVAAEILRNSGHDLDGLRQIAESTPTEELVSFATGTVVEMSVEGTVIENEPVWNIIGHLPGTAGQPGHQMDDQLVVVMAQYDSSPLGPNGEIFQGANDNSSGVALMLEVIETMQSSGYQPYRTFLFVAYSGEGLEWGESVLPPEVFKLLQAKHGFSSAFDIEAIVELRGLGSGSGEGLELLTGGSLRLANLFEDAARHAGVRTTRGGENVDMSVVFETGSARDSGEEAPRIGVTWEGWEATSRMEADTIGTISAEKLEQSGRTVSLALMILGREINY